MIVGHLVSPMTLSANFDSPNGPSPQTTLARTVTVPAGNSGIFKVTFTSSGAATFEYSINGGAFQAMPASGGTLNAITTGQTLQFKLTAGVPPKDRSSIQLIDNPTNTNVGATFSITAT